MSQYTQSSQTQAIDVARANLLPEKTALYEAAFQAKRTGDMEPLWITFANSKIQVITSGTEEGRFVSVTPPAGGVAVLVAEDFSNREIPADCRFQTMQGGALIESLPPDVGIAVQAGPSSFIIPPDVVEQLRARMTTTDRKPPNDVQDQYPLDSEESVWITPESKWNGFHSFQDLFAIRFPDTSYAERIVTGFYKNRGIRLTRLICAGRNYSITCSTLPPGRTIEEELPIHVSRIKDLEAGLKRDLGVATTTCPLGPVLEWHLVDPALEIDDVPFPLHIGILLPQADQHSSTVSAHRLLWRNGSRIELAVILASSKYPDLQEAIDHAQALAQAMQDSLVEETLHLSQEIPPTMHRSECPTTDVRLDTNPMMHGDVERGRYFIDEEHRLYSDTTEVPRDKQNITLTEINSALALVLASRQVESSGLAMDLLKAYPDVYPYATIEDASGKRYTALYLAVVTGNLLLAKVLLEKAPDLTKISVPPEPLIDIAAKSASTEMIDLITSHLLSKHTSRCFEPNACATSGALAPSQAGAVHHLDGLL